jgi:hypothetical protein
MAIKEKLLMISILKFQPSVVDVEIFELFDRSVIGEETMKILLLADKLMLAH